MQMPTQPLPELRFSDDQLIARLMPRGVWFNQDGMTWSLREALELAAKIFDAGRDPKPLQGLAGEYVPFEQIVRLLRRLDLPRGPG
jgi:hypothetical protein